MLAARVLALLLVIGFGTIASADTVTVIDFEGLVEGTAVTTQFSGLTLANATALAAGTTLDEFEFPLHSGANSIFDDAGPMSITFSSPVLAVGGYFDYAMPLTLQAYDSGDNLLGSVTSAFSANLGLSGDPGSTPNEFLQLSFASGISKLVITGDPSGGSFTLDDLTVTTSTQVPEPGTLGLLGAGVIAMTRFRTRKT
jgi:hypothetical protein